MINNHGKGCLLRCNGVLGLSALFSGKDLVYFKGNRMCVILDTWWHRIYALYVNVVLEFSCDSM